MYMYKISVINKRFFFQVFQFILDNVIEMGVGVDCNIIIIQLRRILVVFIVERVVQERGEDLGVSIGYSVRFEFIFLRYYGVILYCIVGKGI